jgi:hypothetical protein
MTRIMIFLYFTISLLKLHLSQDLAGIRLAVHEDAIIDFEKKFLPKLLKRISDLKIDDISKQIDTGIINVDVKLSDIDIKIGEFSPDGIFIRLSPPNSIKVDIRKLNGKGSFHSVISSLGFKLESDVEIVIDRIDMFVVINVDQVDSDIVKGKKMVTAYISKVDFVCVDFDFTLTGLLGKTLMIVKEYIKNYLKVKLQTALDAQIGTASKEFIDTIIKNFPVYLDADKLGDGIALDLSITAPFKIEGEYMIANSNGALINKDIPETIDAYPLPNYLPMHDNKGKNVQVFISEYLVNSDFNTFFLSNQMKFLVTADIIRDILSKYLPKKPDNINVDSTLLDVIFPHLVDIYGHGKPAQIMVAAGERPVVKFTNDAVAIESATIISFQIQKDGVFEQAVSFVGHVTASAKVSLQEGGKISLEVLKYVVNKIALKETVLKEVNVENIASMINLALKAHGPIVINYQFEMPEMIVNLKDSNAFIKEGYIVLTANPQFNLDFIDDLDKEEDITFKDALGNKFRLPEE